MRLQPLPRVLRTKYQIGQRLEGAYRLRIKGNCKWSWGKRRCSRAQWTECVAWASLSKHLSRRDSLYGIPGHSNCFTAHLAAETKEQWATSHTPFIQEKDAEAEPRSQGPGDVVSTIASVAHIQPATTFTAAWQDFSLHLTNQENQCIAFFFYPCEQHGLCSWMLTPCVFQGLQTWGPINKS